MTQDDFQRQQAQSLVAGNYSPPASVASNSDQAVDAKVREILAQMGVVQQAPARALSPTEQARANLENAGAGKGVDERLAELYYVVGVLAAKVGL